MWLPPEHSVVATLSPLGATRGLSMIPWPRNRANTGGGSIISGTLNCTPFQSHSISLQFPQRRRRLVFIAASACILVLGRSFNRILLADTASCRETTNLAVSLQMPMQKNIESSEFQADLTPRKRGNEASQPSSLSLLWFDGFLLSSPYNNRIWSLPGFPHRNV